MWCVGRKNDSEWSHASIHSYQYILMTSVSIQSYSKTGMQAGWWVFHLQLLSFQCCCPQMQLHWNHISTGTVYQDQENVSGYHCENLDLIETQLCAKSSYSRPSRPTKMLNLIKFIAETKLTVSIKRKRSAYEYRKSIVAMLWRCLLKDLIPHRLDDRERRQIGYYQWVPFALAIAAIMFHMPATVWRMLNTQSGDHSHFSSIFSNFICLLFVMLPHGLFCLLIIYSLFVCCFIYMLLTHLHYLQVSSFFIFTSSLHVIYKLLIFLKQCLLD